MGLLWFTPYSLIIYFHREVVSFLFFVVVVMLSQSKCTRDSWGKGGGGLSYYTILLNHLLPQGSCLFVCLLLFFKSNRTIYKSSSIGHHLWSMSLNILTELLVN